MDKKNVLLIITFLAVIPIVTQAAYGGVDVVEILKRIAGLLFDIFNGVVIIMFVYAGFKYLTARGEPGKITDANKALLWAMVGVAVGILANFSSGIVNYFLFG